MTTTTGTLTLRRVSVILIFWGIIFQIGCTSVGNQSRSEPKIAKPAPALTEFGFDGDDNELSLGIESLLDEYRIPFKMLSAPLVTERQGDKSYTYKEVQSRYVLRVRSRDLDMCLPEGSRQMHFDIMVIDYTTRRKVLLIKGEFGCKDTLIREFENWLASVLEQNSPEPQRENPEVLI